MDIKTETTFADAFYDRASRCVQQCDAHLEAFIDNLIAMDTVGILWKGSEPEHTLNLTEDRLQVMFQGMVDAFTDSNHWGVITMGAQMEEFTLQINIRSEYLELVVFNTKTGDLFAIARYSKEHRLVPYHLRLNILEKSLNDLILLDRMDVI